MPEYSYISNDDSVNEHFKLITKGELLVILKDCEKDYLGLQEIKIDERIILKDKLQHHLGITFTETFFQKKNSEDRHKYKAHLAKVDGFISNSLDNFKTKEYKGQHFLTYDPNKTIHLANWHAENFLSVHLYFLMLIYLEIGQNKLDKDLPANKKILLAALLDEIWTTTNACLIRNAYKNILLHHKADSLLLTFFAESFFNFLSEMLPLMQNGDEIRFPCGSQEHAIYLVFARHYDGMLVRVDNLGTGIDYARFVTGQVPLAEKFDDKTPEKGVIPTIISSIGIKEITNNKDKIIPFIIELCRHVLKENSEVLTFIYATIHLPAPPSLEFGYPPLDKQFINNCVAEGFLVGTQYRFWLLDTSKYHEAFTWLMNTLLSYVELEPELPKETAFRKSLAERKIREARLKYVQELAEPKSYRSDFNSLYERFSSFYKTQRVKRTFGESNEGEVFDDLYTRLALIREREVKEEREHCRKDLLSLNEISADRTARDEHLHLFEHILYTERKPLEEEQLFLPMPDDKPVLRQKGRIDRILIRGQAGVGKTTFCHHLARKWMTQGHWVFVIPLRHFRNSTRELTDVGVIEKAFRMKLTELECTLLAELLVDKTQRIYWLLDGADEVTDLPEDHPLSQWLIEAFQKERVIVTTRPRVMKEFAAERQIEMIGYLPEDVEKYVGRYFAKQNKQQTSFMAFINQQKQLGAIHRIPIILELMCWVWNDVTMEQSVNTIELSFTDLYGHVLQGLNRRYVMKTPALQSLAQDATDNEIEEVLRQSYLNPLLELGYQTFMANQLIFSGREVASYLPQLSSNSRRKLLYELGLVRCLRYVEVFNRNEFTFIHLTSQEFLMAKRWVQLFTSKVSNEVAHAVLVMMGRKIDGDWVEGHKYDKRFEVVWGFAAGLLKSQPIHLQRFLDLIAAPPRDQIGARHITLLLQVVGEADCFKEDTREYEWIATWFNNEDYRNIGIEDYGPILGRYPALINYLQKEWGKWWTRAKKDGLYDFVMDLLSIGPLAEKEEIYRDLVDELKTSIRVKPKYHMEFSINLLSAILLTEAQREEIIHLLFNGLQVVDEFTAKDIILVLGRFYLKGPNSQLFQTNLVDQLSIYIEEGQNPALVAAVKVLGKMDLPEDKRLSIVDKLLARLHQVRCESSDDSPTFRRDHIIQYTTEALSEFPIPEKRQWEVTRLLLDRVNDEKLSAQRRALALKTLWQMNPPELLRWEVINTVLESWRWVDNHSEVAPLRNTIFTLVSYQDQLQVLETLLSHLKSNDRNKKLMSLSVLQSMTISKDDQALVLEAVWSCFHDSDSEVKKYAVLVLVRMDILAEDQLPIINAFLHWCTNIKSNLDLDLEVSAALRKTVSERLKPKVINTFFKFLSQEGVLPNIRYRVVRLLGSIGISQKVSKKIMELLYMQRDYAFHALNPYCLILDDDLPYYLREVHWKFVFQSADAEEVHLAGTFNHWLNAQNGKIDIFQRLWKMHRIEKGIWELAIRLLAGSYEFKYVIDRGRRWEHDPSYPLNTNGNSELKIAPAIHVINETNVNTPPFPSSSAANSHTHILSQLGSNPSQSSAIISSPSLSKPTIKNAIESIAVDEWEKQINQNYVEFKTKQPAISKFTLNEAFYDELANEVELSETEQLEVEDSNASEEEAANDNSKTIGK